MKSVFTLLLPILGLGAGYLLWGHQERVVFVDKPVIKTVEVKVVENVCLEPTESIKPSCDFSSLEQVLINKDQEILELQTKLSRVPTAYALYHFKEVLIPQKVQRHLVFLSGGYGVKGVDIRTNADETKVYGVPKKGMVGGIGYMYHVPEFKIPLTNIKVDNLNVGGQIVGAETQLINFGLSW